LFFNDFVTTPFFDRKDSWFPCLAARAFRYKQVGNFVSATLFTGLPLFASYRRKSPQPIPQATPIERPAEVAAAS
jgi:hypothetical protein